MNRLVGSNPTSPLLVAIGHQQSATRGGRDGRRADRHGARGDAASCLRLGPHRKDSWFSVPDEEDLDPHVKELVEKQREKLGAPNNVVRTHAWRPELMLRWLDFYEYISKGPSGLSRVEREMIGVVVSAENRCVF